MDLKSKIKQLPLTPGVYFFKNSRQEIIYIGKASVLKNRVKQYFFKSKILDSKTRALISQIHDLDWVEVKSELDALFLEAEMVKRYKPIYNILLRDDKSVTYIRIKLKDEWPYLSYTRNPLDDGAKYFGPYYNGVAIKKALRYLRRIFPYYLKPYQPGKEHQLSRVDRQIGLEPSGLTSSEYKDNLRELMACLEGKQGEVEKRLIAKMEQSAINQQFEGAVYYRNQLLDIKKTNQQILFGDEEFVDINKDLSLASLKELLGLDKVPGRVEGFDVSHTSGFGVVGSMVVFKNGLSSKTDYRKFKLSQNINNDYQNIAEIVRRRFNPKNIKAWGKPDLVLIDGGVGQLEVALKAVSDYSLGIPFIGLAERLEQIIVPSSVALSGSFMKDNKAKVKLVSGFWVLSLPNSNHVVKFLQRLRDESHRFAINYHKSLRKQQVASWLDDIPGVGPITRKKLMKKFGSTKGIKEANQSELEALVGEKITQRIIAQQANLR